MPETRLRRRAARSEADAPPPPPEAKDDSDARVDAKHATDDEAEPTKPPSAAAIYASRIALGAALADEDDEIDADCPPPPHWLEVAVATAGPPVEALAARAEAAAEVALPFAKALWAVARFYVTDEGATAGLGLLVCFFGGSFVRLIAVAEALHVTGAWRAAEAALSELRNHVHVVAAAEAGDAGRPSMGRLRRKKAYGAERTSSCR
mmetsp:Transcript_8952/g.27978  ORF Transcript_8952/g.27978 Transcript_8952/m.27978 type:complete len:207 (+) Transcript_8952:116-736(+)